MEILDSLDFGDSVKNAAIDRALPDIITARLEILLQGLHEMTGINSELPLATSIPLSASHLTATMLEAIRIVAAQEMASLEDLHVRTETRQVDFQLRERPVPSVALQRIHFRLIVAPNLSDQNLTHEANRTDENSVLTDHTDKSSSIYDHFLRVRFQPPSLESITSALTKEDGHSGKVITSVIQEQSASLQTMPVKSVEDVIERITRLMGIARVRYDDVSSHLQILSDGALYDSLNPREAVQFADLSFRKIEDGASNQSQFSLRS